MPNVEAVAAGQKLDAEFPLAELRCDLSELASRLDLPLYTWEEDGLGSARGALCRLPSGRLFLLQELEHAAQHLGSPGPLVLVDAEVLADLGVDAILSEILAGLGVPPEAVTWVQDRDAQAEAAAVATAATAYHRRSST